MSKSRAHYGVVCVLANFLLATVKIASEETNGSGCLGSDRLNMSLPLFDFCLSKVVVVVVIFQFSLRRSTTKLSGT